MLRGEEKWIGFKTVEYELELKRISLKRKATSLGGFERKTGLGPATPTLARSCSTN